MQEGAKMSIELETPKAEEKKVNMQVQGGASDSVYGLGMIGAWIYYIGRAKDFREGVIGFLKGLVWPAILVYELLKFLERNRPEEEEA
jgi:hypothetical protein